MTARARFGELVRAAGGAVKVAPQLGCSRAYVDMIIAGRRSPGMKVAYATEQLFGLRMQAWVEDRAAAPAAAQDGGGR